MWPPERVFSPAPHIVSSVVPHSCGSRHPRKQGQPSAKPRAGRPCKQSRCLQRRTAAPCAPFRALRSHDGDAPLCAGKRPSAEAITDGRRSGSDRPQMRRQHRKKRKRPPGDSASAFPGGRGRALSKARSGQTVERQYADPPDGASAPPGGSVHFSLLAFRRDIRRYGEAVRAFCPRRASFLCHCAHTALSAEKLLTRAKQPLAEAGTSVRSPRPGCRPLSRTAALSSFSAGSG